MSLSSCRSGSRDKVVSPENCDVLVAQSCPTLCDPVDCSPPGSSVHGILQARILEWVVIPLSKGSSQPRDRTQVSVLWADSLPSEPPGKPGYTLLREKRFC